MKYLFLLTITPVQDFISQARKLKDLYGGSHILSEMSKVGIGYAQNKGAKVIFPQKINSDNSYPNRFLIEISFETEAELKKFAQDISSKIINSFKSLNKTNSPIIKQHIEKFLQIYWSASKYNDDYKKAFNTVEKRLAGAKNTRFFNQLKEVGRKCSICGERNIAIYKKPMRFYIDEQINNLIEAKNSDNFQNGEGLCGICYIKRVSYSKGFNSTADIAIMNIPKKLREEYKLLFKDSQLFYEENLTKEYFSKNGLAFNTLKDCQEEYKKFKQKIKDKYKQTSYYAVIMFDGDDMGEWLSGERVKDETNLKEFHEDISLNLAIFAKEAKEILNEPKGMTVYAGGEDFLGFVNLNNLFEVLKALNDKFRELVNEPIKEKYNLSDNFTFSAGVVVVHYKTPLGTVLNEVRKSEKKAKGNSGKDSVCLTVLKRSGEIREAIIKHNKINTINKIIFNLKDEFSDSFISNLEKEFLVMVDDGVLDLKKSIITTEIKRLLGCSKKVETANIEDMSNFISSLYTKEFSNFANLLAILKFINKEI